MISMMPQLRHIMALVITSPVCSVMNFASCGRNDSRTAEYRAPLSLISPPHRMQSRTAASMPSSSVLEEHALNIGSRLSFREGQHEEDARLHRREVLSLNEMLEPDVGLAAVGLALTRGDASAAGPRRRDDEDALVGRVRDPFLLRSARRPRA